MLNDINVKYRSDGVIVFGPPVEFSNGLTVGGASLAGPNTVQPDVHGLIGWSYDPSFASTGQLLTNGTLYLSKIKMRAGATITKVWWAQSAAAVTPVSGQSFAMLLNAAGTVLSSAGIDSQIAGSNGPQSATLAAAQAVAAGDYYVGIFANAATAPTLVRTNGILTGVNNANLSGASLRYATNGTALTSVPASVTPASAAAGPSLWVAVS